jgi:hypothetical protein
MYTCRFLYRSSRLTLYKEKYAISEASFLIVRLLQAFDGIEWLGAPGKIKKGLGLTMFPGKSPCYEMLFSDWSNCLAADGVPVRLRKAA